MLRKLRCIIRKGLSSSCSWRSSTGELRKNVSSDLLSQASTISEAASAFELTISASADDSSSSFTDSESELHDSSSFSITNQTDDDLAAKVAACEKELQIANEKMQLSLVEITRLKLEVQKYKSLEEGAAVSESSEGKLTKIQKPAGGLHDHDSIDTMEESRSQEQQVNNDYHLLLNDEGSESCKLQERIDSLLVVLSEGECKIRELEIALSDSERKAVAENAMIETGLKEQLREYKSRCESLIAENTIIRVEKADCELLMKQLKEENSRLEGSLETLKSDKYRLQEEIDAVRVELQR